MKERETIIIISEKRVVGSNELDRRRKKYQWWAKSPRFNPSILLTDYCVNHWERHFNANNLTNLAHSASGNAESQKTLPREQDQWAAVCQGPGPHTLCTPLEAHSLPDSTAAAPGHREASGSPRCLPSSCLISEQLRDFGSAWSCGGVILRSLGPPWLPHLPLGSGSWVSHPLQGQM